MIELEQAIALVTGALSPQIDSELVPLAQASGRVTACALSGAKLCSFSDGWVRCLRY